jgi:hypothetical protein
VMQNIQKKLMFFENEAKFKTKGNMERLLA